MSCPPVAAESKHFSPNGRWRCAAAATPAAAGLGLTRTSATGARVQVHHKAAHGPSGAESPPRNVLSFYRMIDLDDLRIDRHNSSERGSKDPNATRSGPGIAARTGPPRSTYVTQCGARAPADTA